MERSDGSYGVRRPSRHPGRLPKLHGQDITRELPAGTFIRDGAADKSRLHLLLGVVIAILVTLVLCVLVYQLVSSTSERSPVRCTSESCVAHSRRLQATLNTSVDPCQDFYSFVCDGWQRAFPHLSVLDKINEDAIKSNIKEVTDDLWYVGKPSRLYYKCTTPERDEVSENVRYLKEFKEFISLHWPEKEPEKEDFTVHPLNLMVYMAITYDISFLFSLDIRYSNVSGNVIIFRKRNHDIVWGDRIERPLSAIEYARIVREHLTALDVESIKITTAQLQALERAFLADSQTTVHSQQSWFLIETLNSKTPSIQKGIWFYSLHSNFDNFDITVTDNTWIVFEQPTILNSIGRLFETYSAPDIRTGISWMFIQSHLWAVTGKPELMFRDNIEEKKQRACLEFVNSRFGLLSSAHFMTTRFPTPETRQEVANFIISVKTAFKSLAKNASWIDIRSRETTERKIDSMDISILPAEPFFSPLQLDAFYAPFTNVEGNGFVFNWLVNCSLQYQILLGHKHFKDIYSKRRSFHHTPYSYTYLVNEISAPISAIDPPLLYSNGPFAVNYASAGSLIAREIAKSLDSRGTQIDDRGENVIWWGKSHSAEYSRRISCDLGETGQPRMNLFPSIPALEASFFAYKTAVAEEAAMKGYFRALYLAGLEHYTEEQVFFMTYCYALCSRKDTSSALHHCNVPLRHSPHFAEAFKCPPGSPMNAIEKCTFFASA